VIEQTDPNTVYVPYYEPATVYAHGPMRTIRPITSAIPTMVGAGVVAAGHRLR